MPRTSTDTKQRILAAAVDEFARHGIAGARVDRIAATAAINKAQLYAHIGNKEALFDSAFDAHVNRLIDRVPLTAEDLPGYATRLYDAYLADPALVRLLTWARLERRPEGDLFPEPSSDTAKLAAIEQAQADGHLDPDFPAPDLWAMIVALAATWAQAAIITTATASEPREVHERRRTSLHRAVTRAFTV